jgi:hypothetical protein
LSFIFLHFIFSFFLSFLQRKNIRGWPINQNWSNMAIFYTLI